MVTQERLLEVLNYNPSTGIFIWRMVLSKRTQIGSIAGTDKDGYVNISIDKRLYRAHRLAWMYMTGEWPSSLMDHKDLNRSNNKWDNLRLATNTQNSVNSPKLCTNTSGYKGVRWYKANSRWSAQIGMNGKMQHLGYFDTAKEAYVVYCLAAQRLWGDFARVA
jgi:hypothetical protein